MSKQLFERILEINTNGYLENGLTSIQRQEIVYPFIFLPGEKSMQNPPSNSNRDNTLSNITSLMDNKKTAQFAIVNSMSDDDDDQKMQLFKDYKLILCQALKIVEEQDNIGNKRWDKQSDKFKGIKSLVTDIDKYERQITNPHTFTINIQCF
ncbi:hypothetical protein RhiirA1_468717 [Rhizophagus irregularis]|uniref:Uncharacterized protein n=4 Tax=Rhizophagus irregularis TaxID=588596 RepID=A0A2I1ELL3_9GLOM|nr:hypothetical protein GLOIN_2v1773680 [Rhizophagus irregularis DAOM 181602=DAOM 197198]PKC59947.1 hypothetical protein RhiirA1_468717 [Rhizophagus irregularis]PKY22982.1 hypothetical protein RhiirB3_437063 [Rhizophagus irregularis]POG72510.1 hypothetical protein GLOIN_2v1773680 [Rhizophagus irregularis DAOM 181602=DAOM 197198]|eukprot:XP_025179376.1 hypothetical protein GLOIN_2v1773680 [Rhizophagus irregularis DAOM 181602=DAOM 197198]